jgi:hypothetical protein
MTKKPGSRQKSVVSVESRDPLNLIHTVEPRQGFNRDQDLIRFRVVILQNEQGVQETAGEFTE